MHHLLWFPGHILRKSFIIWLAFMGHIHTMNRLHAYQIISFLVCDLHVKTHNHLSFSVLSLLHCGEIPLAKWVVLLWHDDLCFSGHTHYRKKEELLVWLVLLAMIYFIWYERNNQVFHQAYHPYHIVSK
jgi:hypothetical protein